MPALDDIKVVDLTRVVAGPFCAALLADMGADVIKVEHPGKGDQVRGQGVMLNGISTYFAQYNRNKRSITIDLYTADGKAILSDLIRGADVLLENYRPGVLAKMGFDAARLDALNPNLIVGSINGYGSTGPYKDRPSFDFIAQAMSGFMSVSGAADGPPMRAGPPLADLVAGLYTAFGVACALVNRGSGDGGGGQHVESSLMGGLVSMLAYMSADYFATGSEPRRTGNDHPVLCPYGLFRAKDGDVAIAPAGEVFLQRFFEVLDMTHLYDDPDFADNDARVRNLTRMNAIVDEKIGQNSVDYWIDTLNAAGVPCGQVQDMDTLFRDPQLLSQDMVLSVDHPGHGPIRMTGFPVKMSETPCELRLPAPELGADTEAVLRELGYGAEKIAALRDKGVT
ncbi:MAG: CoA transferase [Rhodospirillaceae bacterium]|nr:CoA transferase [Rhodospirillaceae bacterium]MDD9917455.1 CoA transferase [Rhodospirillaceae bacterium]